MDNYLALGIIVIVAIVCVVYVAITHFRRDTSYFWRKHFE